MGCGGSKTVPNLADPGGPIPGGPPRPTPQVDPLAEDRPAPHNVPGQVKTGTADSNSPAEPPAQQSAQYSSPENQPSKWDEMGASSLKEALRDTTLVDADYLVGLADSGGTLPRCQDVPLEAVVTLTEMEAWGEEYTVAVLVVSYPWLDRNHPDPHGEQLRKLAFVLKAFAEKAREYKGCRVGVFWDYPSLPQKSVGCSGDEDDRTKEEMARFKRALKGINTWYGHQKTHVLLVTTPLPDAHEYTNMQPYDGRGWCKAERLMSVIVKDTDALIDLSQLQGDESSYAKIIEKGKSNRDPPMAPDAFHAMLTSGVEDGTIKFTNKGDVDLVAHIYKTAFLDEMTAATKLFYIQLDWGDEQVATLSAALAFAHARGALANLQVFNIARNQIGDTGLASFSSAIASGALTQLKGLDLRSNRIGDAGLTSLSEVLASGALAKLQNLNVDDSDHPELKKVCETRNINV